MLLGTGEAPLSKGRFKSSRSQRGSSMGCIEDGAAIVWGQLIKATLLAVF